MNRGTLISGVLLWAATGVAMAQPTAPGQPAQGPGGRSYPHASVVMTTYGTGSAEYRIIEPDGPRPASAPVVVFCHGWGAVNPRIYGAWIEHIVRRGNIVIFPRYQRDLTTPTEDFTPAAIDSVKQAFAELASGNHVKPQLDKVAIVGHSVGGILTANLAALAAEHGLPQPRAIMPVQPGITRRVSDNWRGVPLADLAKIPAGTLMVVMVGDQDQLVGRGDGDRIYTESTAVAAADKDLLMVHTDLHGTPPLVADHSSPSAMKMLKGDEFVAEAQQEARQRGGPLGGAFAVNLFNAAAANSLNTLDYYGYWKLFDALCDAAFEGKDRDTALGGGPGQVSMGRWSDGTAVQPMERVEPSH